MRKRLAIVGHSEEGLSLIELLEANPDVEVHAILSDDPATARGRLVQMDPVLAERYTERITDAAESVLRTPGLVALIDADAGDELRDVLAEAPGRGVQVTSPLIAKLLYAFGPVDATRKPDLLQTLSEILESYNLTIDRKGLLSRILQIAVGSTGADRGSLMLWDPASGQLAVEVAIGLEKELIPKIRIAPGEGIAGLAFQGRHAILMHGKADRKQYRVLRERDDVESAISAPLIYRGEVLGVLNLSHARQRGAFDEEDLAFVEQLAALDAKIIARAEEYHSLLRDSARLRAESEVRELLGSSEPLMRRLSAVCGLVAREFQPGLSHLYLYDPELDTLVLNSSSVPLDPLTTPMRLDRRAGIHGLALTERRTITLCAEREGGELCFAVIPLLARGELLGLLVLEGGVPAGDLELVREKVDAIASTVAAELWDTLRESRIEREATRMTAITEAASLMNLADEAPELHRRITGSAATILEAEHAVLRLRDESSGRFQIRSYFGSAETDAQPALFEFEKELSIRAIGRREPQRLVDIASDPELTRHSPGIGSALVQLIKRDQQVVGTLSILGKVASTPLAGEHFSAADATILAHFAEHAQHALAQLQERESLRHQRRFDELTGLPNALHLRERLEQELARASGSSRSLCLIRLQIEGLGELLAEQRETEGDRLVLSIAQELRASLRDFDVLARSEPGTFEILVPEPDQAVASLLGPLARRASDAIRREPDPSLPDRLHLHFGYAEYPLDGNTARELSERARTSRITSD